MNINPYLLVTTYYMARVSPSNVFEITYRDGDFHNYILSNNMTVNVRLGGRVKLCGNKSMLYICIYIYILCTHKQIAIKNIIFSFKKYIQKSIIYFKCIKY